MAGVLARAQTRLGYPSFAYTFTQSHFKFSADFWLDDPNSEDEKLKKAHRFFQDFNVFQFYFGESLLGPSLEDVEMLHRRGKKLFFYFCGCDIRDEKTTVQRYEFSACAECFPKLCSPNQKRARAVAARYSKQNFVSTPDLLEFVDRSVLLPQPIDFELIEEIAAEPPPIRNPDRLLVAHAPTNRALKGTDYILAAIKSLQSRGVPIDLCLIERMEHAEALRNYRRADVAVDQILIGAYGMVSAEMMALGVPVVVSIREDLLPHYPIPPPVVNANPLNIEQVLLALFERRDVLSTLSALGVSYAYQMHHPSRIAMRTLEYYQS